MLRGTTIRSRRRASFSRAPVPAVPAHARTSSGTGVRRVLLQEQLLQRRRLAGQALDTVLAEAGQDLADPGGVDGEGHAGPVGGEVLDAGDALEELDRRCVREDRVHAGAAEVAHVGEGARLDGAAEADDAHLVGEGLDLAEDVAGEQHGAALAAQLLHDAAEDGIHQRVQPGRRLVEEEQLDVGGERGDEGDLLPVALGVGAALLGRVELEPLDERRRDGATSMPPRSRPSRSMTSPPVRLGQRLTSPGT